MLKNPCYSIMCIASHEHRLKLEFSSPYENCNGFCCDVCRNPGSDHWLYRCNECEFDVHISCVYSVPSPQFRTLVAVENNYNMVTSPTIASTSSSAAILVNGNSVLQTSGNYINQSQSQNPLSSSTRSLGMPENNVYMMVTRAPPSNTNTTYAMIMDQALQIKGSSSAEHGHVSLFLASVFNISILIRISSRVKRAQLQALSRDFETLQMKDGESVTSYYARTMEISNKMRFHGEKMEDVTIVEKILRF
ncbi:hypothetical protein GH714_036694 [Hevea brasiliensis]|uniref:DC1 domain-containing protein n=1 Tax=Hevea brasiliensis TaxID=3981 RepID=A0A6A6KNB5_HEVBR|nr:hypothetical protein GH714_036694 [Hevea brasiliensis]